MTKVVAPKGGWNNRSTEVLLPLVSSPKEHTKTNSVSFSIQSNITDKDSPKYTLYILKIQGGEDVCTLIQWMQDCKKIITGMELTNGKAINKIVQSLLSGNPANL